MQIISTSNFNKGTSNSGITFGNNKSISYAFFLLIFFVLFVYLLNNLDSLFTISSDLVYEDINKEIISCVSIALSNGN